MNQADVLCEAVISEVVLPILEKLGKEAEQPIVVRVSVLSESAWTTQEVSTGSAEPGSAATGEVRAILKRVGPDSVNLVAESILKNLSPGSGYSGFSLKGKLEFRDGKWLARVAAHTNRYNVWDWRNEFIR